MSIYDENDPFIEWNEANEAGDDGEAVMAAERRAGSAVQGQAGDAGWTADDEAAAVREGWGIFDCDGPDNGLWQKQKLDGPDDLDEVITATAGRIWDEDNQA